MYNVYIQFTLTHKTPLLTDHYPSQTAPPNQHVLFMYKHMSVKSLILKVLLLW